ncbi:hypothetical protein [Thalassococcus lentus]|uniref:Uncharacterized protein n=1 Tax=Thalassococcus lentus TaxID=1210524 RepID=A0ABT4XTW6_9RHOB|nr:hypothetical protein [Thalassococcus lentus]MDA7425421.1 hypothetical protein [Thalassococcus lentus]
MNLFMNRATRARIHLAVLEAMPDGQDDMAAAFAETCAYAENPGEVFELARAIDAHIFAKVHYADVQYADVDADDLRALHGVEDVNWALRLCGIRARSAQGRKVRWTDAPDREPTMPVKLPATLLEQWNSE